MTLQDPDRLTVPPDGRAHSQQPHWRQDFPIEWAQDNYISRRDFTRFMVLTSLAFVVGQFIILFQNILRRNRGELPRQQIADLNEIPAGSSRVFHYPDERTPRILVRLDETSFVAYEQQCTHLACPVIPRPETGHLHCPCHEGLFDLRTGQPLVGPPRRPLARVRLEVQADKIYAVGVEEALV